MPEVSILGSLGHWSPERLHHLQIMVNRRVITDKPSIYQAWKQGYLFARESEQPAFRLSINPKLRTHVGGRIFSHLVSRRLIDERRRKVLLLFYVFFFFFLKTRALSLYRHLEYMESRKSQRLLLVYRPHSG